MDKVKQYVQPVESGLTWTWWQRALWGLGCGVVAFAAAWTVLLVGLYGHAYFWPEAKYGWDGFAIYLLWHWQVALVTLIGLVVGVIYPGRLGVVVALLMVCGSHFLLAMICSDKHMRNYLAFLLPGATIEALLAVGVYYLRPAVPAHDNPNNPAAKV